MHGPMPAQSARAGAEPASSPRRSPPSRQPARRASRHAPRPRSRLGGEQNRRAIGREDAERDPGSSSPSRRRAASLAPPRGFDRRSRRGRGPDGADQTIGRQPEPGSRERAVLLDIPGASREPKPQFSDANMPPLTPPWRVKKACRIPDRRRKFGERAASVISMAGSLSRDPRGSRDPQGSRAGQSRPAPAVPARSGPAP